MQTSFEHVEDCLSPDTTRDAEQRFVVITTLERAVLRQASERSGRTPVPEDYTVPDPEDAFEDALRGPAAVVSRRRNARAHTPSG